MFTFFVICGNIVKAKQKHAFLLFTMFLRAINHYNSIRGAQGGIRDIWCVNKNKERINMSIAVITGASSGIGREFAFKLRDLAGVSEFWFIARSVERMERVRDELGLPCKIISADLATREGIEKYRTALEAEKPEISYLVNAAGFGVFGSFDILSEDTVTDMIDVNIKATVLITHMSDPYMKRGGRIIELGSGSCFTPLPHFNITHRLRYLCFIIRSRSTMSSSLTASGQPASAPDGWIPRSFPSRLMLPVHTCLRR